jgi:transcription factor TGA
MSGFQLHYKLFMLLQTLLPQLDPLTEQQVVGICNLQQSSQQAEEALSQGLDQLHQSLASTMAGGSVTEDPNTNFMSQMSLALSKLTNLEGFVIQVMFSHQIFES